MQVMTKPHVADPTTPSTKPHGTTADQVAEMEYEGQAQELVATDQEVDTLATGLDQMATPKGAPKAPPKMRP
jgi:hypothetical protein